MNKQEIIISEDISICLTSAVNQCPHDRLFILTDNHTKEYCLPVIQSIDCLNDAEIITIKAGDLNKNIESLINVWTQLSNDKGSRHSLIINLGGGMVTDLGGFAASTFKRGITYINIPTTLLAMADASTGGKTGINFNGLKNEIGVFSPARFVLLDTEFLKTLDNQNIRSGYAEMLKHGLISNEKHWAELIDFDLDKIDYQALQSLIAHSVSVKEEIVRQDPFEQNIRKALNLGHTVGHAFENMAMAQNNPIPHGYAVAWGIVCELYYSCLKTNFPKDKMRQTARFIKDTYNTFNFDCSHYEQLYGYMTHDKKNEGDKINFTLLSNIGKIQINQSAGKQEIFDMLDFYRESMN